ncbi:transmembrane protein, putative [Rhizoctonia solani AG-3 Rhs1AP]|uniref:Transmembrane protein, putative n=1 Tax=Rhizoctonia solani AG-3 Rhs1AP TaxID=1086054 RepID=X8IZ66_9AGAM|nr:transmembrane protein, putative [Rhizoctonia solani AG-3 Rhs1AP]
MNFKLLFLLLWLLAFLLPGSDVRTYIQLLSDAGTIVLDQPMNNYAASNSVFLVSAAFPTPRSCYTPPVFPFYFGKARARGPKPSRFNRGKRVVRIYKWMNVFYAQMISHIECSRPTKTSNPPTRVVALAYPAPPTAGRYLLDDAPAQILTNLAIDLAGLWNAYKLIFGWIAFTLLISAFTFVRFISFHSTTVHLSDFADPAVDDIHSSDDSGAVSGVSLLPSLPFDSEASIIDMYHSLDYPPFTPDDIPFGLTTRANPTSQNTTMSIATNNELFPRTYSSSVCTDVAFALPAWIDTKTGVEGSTEMNGTSVEGKILEPAVSNSSIGSVFKFYGGGSRAITPSSSSLSIPCSSEELLARYPASGQSQSTTGRWLEDFITHLRSMERQGNHFGRVYDGWTGNLELEP